MPNIGDGIINIFANDKPFRAVLDKNIADLSRIANKGVDVPIRAKLDKSGLNKETEKIAKQTGSFFQQHMAAPVAWPTSFLNPTATRGMQAAAQGVNQLTNNLNKGAKAATVNAAATNKVAAAQGGLIGKILGSRKELQKALVTGGQLATAFTKLGAAGIPLGTTISRILGIAVAGQEATKVIGPLGGFFPNILKGVQALGALGPVALLGVAAAAVTVVGALVGIVKLVQSSIPVAMEAEQAYAQVAASINATGGAAGFTVAELQAFNEELENATSTSSTTLASLEAIVLSFDKIQGDNLTRAVTIANDFMVRFGSSAKEAGRAVGLALQDPARGLENLGEQGIRFTEAEKEMITAMVDAGNIADAQTTIMDRLEKAVGGAGEAFAQTAAGKIANFRNTLNDLRTVIGNALLPAIGAIANAASNFIAGFQEAFSVVAKGTGSFKSLLAPFAAIAFLATRAAAVLGGMAGILASLVAQALKLLTPLTHLVSVLDTLGVISLDSAEAAEKTGDAFDHEKEAAERLAKGLENVIKAQREVFKEEKNHEKALLDIDRTQLQTEESARKLTEAQRIYEGTLKGFPKTSEEARKALEEYNDAEIANKQAQLGKLRAALDEEKAIEARTEAQKKFNETLNGVPEGSKEAVEAIDDLDDATRKLHRSQLDLLEAQNKLKESQLELALQQKLAGYIARAYGANSYAAQKATVELEKTQLGFRDSQLDVRDSQNEVGDAQRDLVEQQRVTNGVLNGYAVTSKEAKEATIELKDAEIAVTAAGYAVTAAHLAAEKAAFEFAEETRELKGVLEGFPATSKEAIKATDDFKNAQIDAKGAVIEAALAVNELAEAWERLVEAQKESETIRVNHEKARKREEKRIKSGSSGFGSGSSLFDPFRFEGYAHGGKPRRGTWGVVGERGPELMYFGHDTTVKPIKKGTPRVSVMGTSGGGRPLVIQLDGRTIARALVPHQNAMVREYN